MERGCIHAVGRQKGGKKIGRIVRARKRRAGRDMSQMLPEAASSGGNTCHIVVDMGCKGEEDTPNASNLLVASSLPFRY